MNDFVKQGMTRALKRVTLREVADQLTGEQLASFGNSPEAHERLLDAPDLIALLHGNIVVKQLTVLNGWGWYPITGSSRTRPVIEL